MEALFPLLCLGVAVALGYALWRRFARRAPDWRGEALQALADCGQLLQLLAALQQHRGMSSAWLAGGGEGFGAAMRARRAEIEAVLPEVLRIAGREARRSRPAFTVHEAHLLRHRWQELASGLGQVSAELNLVRHSWLIERLLALLSALGEAYIERPGAALLPRGLARNYVGRLPALAECLGQARAIGSSVVAAGQCPAVDRVRLMFLVARAESLLLRAGEVGRGGGAAAALARRHVELLAATVRSRVLGSGEIDIHAEDYYATASQAIDSVFAWLCDAGEALRSGLGSAPRMEGGR